MSSANFCSMLTQKQEKPQEVAETADATQVDVAPNKPENRSTTVNVKLATLTRKKTIVISCLFFSLSLIFLVLTIIGNIDRKPVIQSTYFIKLDLANIIPASTPGELVLVNSLARSLGLHDFYQVGLWNFCEGYKNEGVTYCAKPQARYWFNPVEILMNELLAGATIALPADINKILDLVKLASSIMFSFFIAGMCMNLVSIFVAPITLYSRWWSLPFAIWAFVSALLTTVATIIVTAMSIIFVDVANSQPGLNIGASIGKPFFAFMWLATSFNILGWLVHLSLMCCCASRRDVATGRRKGRESAYGDVVQNEKMKFPKVKTVIEKLSDTRKNSAGEAV